MRKTKTTIAPAPFSLASLVDAIAKEKNVPKDSVIRGLEKAYLSIAKKKFSPIVRLEADYMPENNMVMVLQYKKVVDVVTRPDLELSLLEAKRLDPESEVGDELGLDVSDKVQIKRNDVLLVRQIVSSSVKEATKEQLIADFTTRKGEIVTGIVKRVDQNSVLVDLGKSDAVLLTRDLIGGETFKVKDKIQALLLDVYSTPQGAELRLSRSSHKFVLKLLEQEVAEISDGLVDVVRIAREPGLRTKIVVRSNDQSTNPVHSVLGNKGFKIQQIMNQLNNEKVNVLQELKDRTEFIKECAKPGEVSKIIETDSIILLVSEDDKLGKLLGAKASNLRLAASLLGKKVGAITESSYKKQQQNLREKLTTGSVNELIVGFLVGSNAMTKQELLAVVDRAKNALSVTDEDLRLARTVLGQLALDMVIKEDAYGEPREFTVEVSNESKENAMKKAEMKLREELASFGLKRN
jgi:N utilization substance protein A